MTRTLEQVGLFTGKNTLGPPVQSSAIFSPCRTWRYQLAREVWPTQSLTVNVIMLNPSTADETVDDPTIRRCIGYAKSWGYRTLVVTNLFAYRATDPRDLKQATDPIGPDNDAILLNAAVSAARVMVAWGVHGAYLNRTAAVLAMLRRAGVTPFCLGVTKDGHPRHPLYLPGELSPMPYGGPRVVVAS